MVRIVIAVFGAIFLVACGDSSPGPLAGTWQSTGPLSMRTTFRNDETETLGVIEKVGYQIEGQSVIVSHKDGLMKGTAVRYEMVNATTLKAMGQTYQKVGN